MSNPSILRVGLVGHRDITEPEDIDHLRNEARQYFKRWQAEFDSIEIFSQLAVGADTILTLAGLEYDAQVVAIVPYEQYADDFTASEWQSYQQIVDQAQHVEHLPYAQHTEEAYLAAGVWIVDHVDVLLAAWDGQPAHGKGGTAEIVAYARQQQKQVCIINTKRSELKAPPKATATSDPLDPESSAEKEDVSMLEMRFREYLAIVENTTKLSDRRQTINDIFVGLNSLFLTAFGFLFVSSHFTTWWTPTAFGIVTIFTTGDNVIWLILLRRYSRFINIRMSYITALEKNIAEAGKFDTLQVPIRIQKGKEITVPIAFGVHLVESQTQLYENAPKLGFSSPERNLIYFFMVAYVVLTFGVCVLTYLVTNGIIPKFSL